MAAVPRAARGWWHYSKLEFIPLGTTGILIALLAVPALIWGDVFLAAMAGGLAVLWLAYLGWGVVNAERARRYGCW